LQEFRRLLRVARIFASNETYFLAMLWSTALLNS
jgi:hypothetical protein